MSQVFQEHSHCYDKRKKQENENYENIFIFAATPSLSGRRGGGGGADFNTANFKDFPGSF